MASLCLCDLRICTSIMLPVCLDKPHIVWKEKRKYCKPIPKYNISFYLPKISVQFISISGWCYFILTSIQFNVKTCSYNTQCKIKDNLKYGKLCSNQIFLVNTLFTCNENVQFKIKRWYSRTPTHAWYSMWSTTHAWLWFQVVTFYCVPMRRIREPARMTCNRLVAFVNSLCHKNSLIE